MDEEKKNPFVGGKERKEAKSSREGAEQMCSAFMSIIDSMTAALDAEKITESLKEKCTAWFVKEYGAVPVMVQPVNAVTGELMGKPENRILPSCAEDVMKLISNRIPVFLVGPAGCGKNEMAKALAEMMGLDYYYSNCVTMEHKITGWTNSQGKYMETPFYKAWTQGGLFLLDEMDASTPEVIDIMNMAIANGMCDFPAPIGNLPCHENFRLIAAGNTFGEGADSQYSSRNKLDAATLDRFACVEMDYEEKVEDAICPDKELADFLRSLREAMMNAGIDGTITYRCFGRSYRMKEALGKEKTLKMCVTKHLRKEDLETLNGRIKKDGEWKTAFKNIIGDWK